MTDYLEQGLAAIRGFLDTELVGPWREIETRIAESGWPGTTHRIQPHVLSEARRILRASGELIEFTHTTHGGRAIDLIKTANEDGRSRAVTDATSRKAKLYGRYLSWAEGPLSDDYPSGVMGLAGERVLQATVRSGLHSLAPGPAGQTSDLLGFPLVGGSYDDYAVLNVIEDGSMLPILLAFEVKNIRRWLYPWEQELHKFLYRSAALQQARPEALICPVIITRRRHAWVLQMAQDLGFYAIQTGIHFVLPTARIELRKFEEVRLGLDFSDLVIQDTASPRLARIFDRSLRRDALATARRWRSNGSQLLHDYDELRRDLSYPERHDAATELREHASQLPESLGSW